MKYDNFKVQREGVGKMSLCHIHNMTKKNITRLLSHEWLKML